MGPATYTSGKGHAGGGRGGLVQRNRFFVVSVLLSMSALLWIGFLSFGTTITPEQHTTTTALKLQRTYVASQERRTFSIQVNPSGKVADWIVSATENHSAELEAPHHENPTMYWNSTIAPPPVVPALCGVAPVARQRFPPHIPLCTHHESDFVSMTLHSHGYWGDCVMVLSLAYLAQNLSEHRLSPTQRYGASGGHGRGYRFRGATVEIGANIGSCTTLLASHGFHVVAFEPSRWNYNILRQSLYNSGFDDRVVLVGAGASDHEEEKRKINMAWGNFGNSIVAKDKSVNVTVGEDAMLGEHVGQYINLARADSVVSHHVHFMKLDCQGHEVHALRGAKQLLSTHRVDVIMAEVSSYMLNYSGTPMVELFDLLSDVHGYSLFTVLDKNSAPAHLRNSDKSTGRRIFYESIVSIRVTKDLYPHLSTIGKQGEFELYAVRPEVLTRIPRGDAGFLDYLLASLSYGVSWLDGFTEVGAANHGAGEARSSLRRTPGEVVPGKPFVAMSYL